MKDEGGTMKTKRREGESLRFVAIFVGIMFALACAARGVGIHDAAEQGDVTRVKTLLAANPEFANAPVTTARCHFYWLCKEGTRR
jgi:hypothetical protein